MSDFIRTFFDKGYAVAECLECDGMRIPFGSDGERAEWVKKHAEGHSLAAAFMPVATPMERHTREIKAEVEISTLDKIIGDPRTQAPPTVTQESLIESIRRFEDSLKKTVIFHPAHYELVHAWYDNYEHPDRITLIQSQHCPQGQVFIFPASLFGSALG